MFFKFKHAHLVDIHNSEQQSGTANFVIHERLKSVDTKHVIGICNMKRGDIGRIFQHNT